MWDVTKRNETLLKQQDKAIGQSSVMASRLALSWGLLYFASDHAVYAWGNNSMGQTGQGHCHTPVAKPKQVKGLDGVRVRQIAAGTSHSAAWTALPADRSVGVPNQTSFPRVPPSFVVPAVSSRCQVG